MSCPYCKKKPSAPKPLYPFCSERCKMSDLGRWMTGDYKIAGKPIDEETLHEDLGRASSSGEDEE